MNCRHPTLPGKNRGTRLGCPMTSMPPVAGMRAAAESHHEEEQRPEEQERQQATHVTSPRRTSAKAWKA